MTNHPNRKQDVPPIRFYWNGMKCADGKLQRCFVSKGYFNDTLTIYAQGSKRFHGEIRNVFTVLNDSDSMTDYFEGDRITVEPSDPHYSDVLGMLTARNRRYGREG